MATPVPVMSSNNNNKKMIRFHYSYGGKIIYRDGKLRYAGGNNGILTVDRCITYTELIVKLWDTCGASMCLRCALPGPGEDNDLELIVHVTSDEDLAFVLEQYDEYDKKLKIRTILDDPIMLTNKPLTKAVVDSLFG